MKLRSILLAVAAVAGLAVGGVALPGSPAQAQTGVGLDFDGLNGTGPAILFSHPATGFVCTLSTADAELGAATMPLGWDNRFSSYLTGAGCWAVHFDGANFTGVFVGPLPGGFNLGPLDNLTSSIIWT